MKTPLPLPPVLSNGTVLVCPVYVQAPYLCSKTERASQYLAFSQRGKLRHREENTLIGSLTETIAEPGLEPGLATLQLRSLSCGSPHHFVSPGGHQL